MFCSNSTSQQVPSVQSNLDYVITHFSSFQHTSNDSNMPQEDNFNVCLLVTHNKRFSIAKDDTLCLRVYVMLTSLRELFPKLVPYNLNEQQGSFRTIRHLPNPAQSMTGPNESRKSSLISGMFESPVKFDRSNGENLGGSSVQYSRNLYDSPFTDFIAPVYSGICDEKINYFGYFNAHELEMQNVLEQKVKQSKSFVQQILANAEVDCRRTVLWSSLLKVNTAGSQSIMSIDELNELLQLVYSVNLDEYDSKLAQLFQFNYMWYKGLAHKLESKFDNHRRFQKDNAIKMVRSCYFSYQTYQFCFR